jgi:hypothetical protein
MHECGLTPAHRLACALDRDDYATAEPLLEPEAAYDSGDSIIHGAAAIIDSFRTTSEWGRANLDALEFSHEIDDDNAPLEIVFIDVLGKNGDELVLRHSMHLTLSDRGLVSELRLERPPGEKEEVHRFFERHGLHRKSE